MSELKIERPYELGEFVVAYVRWHESGKREAVQVYHFPDRFQFTGQYEFTAHVTVQGMEGEAAHTKPIEWSSPISPGAMVPGREAVWAKFDEIVESMREDTEREIKHAVFKQQMQSAQQAPRKPNLKLH